MQEWGLPALHNNEYTTLSPVLSARQLRLEMRQVFEIYHSDMKERGTDKRAYVGLRRSDGQLHFRHRLKMHQKHLKRYMINQCRNFLNRIAFHTL